MAAKKTTGGSAVGVIVLIALAALGMSGKADFLQPQNLLGDASVEGLLSPPSLPPVGRTNPATPTVGQPAAAATPAPVAPSGKQYPTIDAAATRAQLDALTVKGKAPMTGYDRVKQFGPAWKDVDRDGCDTRNQILARDLAGAVFKDGANQCVVQIGTLADPYTGTTIAFQRGDGTSTAVQIDHVVALGNVWVSGGQQLTQTQREQIANDPLNLLAVDGPTNEAKGDANAASWLPPNKAYRCTYVSLQVQVKAKYHLAVTPAEKEAITNVLAKC